MKTKRITGVIILACTALFCLLASFKPKEIKPETLLGAWKYGSPSNQTVLIYSATAFSAATYDLPGKKTINTYGGTWKLEGNNIVRKIEYNMISPDQVGKETRTPIQLSGDRLTIGAESFNRLDDGRPGELEGGWIIIGFYKNGVVDKFPEVLKSRRTMKVLSGTRFQWIAYDIDSKKVLNTGGGTYETSNGMYAENVEFFTKSPDGVGRRLEFEYIFDNDSWRHMGKSSTGGVVDECWVKRETLEK